MKRIKLLALAMCSLASVTLHAQSRNANGTTEGYQPFIELNTGLYTDDDHFTTFEVTTSHGVQLNSKFFVGGGIGLSTYHHSSHDEHDFDDKFSVSIPVFANFKWNILNKKYSPVLDVKAGYSIGGEIEDNDGKPTEGYMFSDGPTGVFASVGVGCRIALGTHAIVPQLTFKNISPKKNHGYKDQVGFMMIGVTYEF